MDVQWFRSRTRKWHAVSSTAYVSMCRHSHPRGRQRVETPPDDGQRCRHCLREIARREQPAQRPARLHIDFRQSPCETLDRGLYDALNSMLRSVGTAGHEPEEHLVEVIGGQYDGERLEVLITPPLVVKGKRIIWVLAGRYDVSPSTDVGVSEMEAAH